ncbi:hypothetical protein ABID59_004386 [Bradyrhizobium sp. S3.3.6]
MVSLVASGLMHGCHAMKFILVNQRTPRGDRTCAECSRSLGPGYVREVVTRREYCNYDCYRRCHLMDIAFPYLTARANSNSDPKDLVPLGLAALLGAASFWFQVGAASMSWINTAAHADEPSAAERPPSA